MAWKGTLGKIYDNTSKKGKPYWSIVIDTKEQGEVKFNTFDSAVADAAKAMPEGAAVLFDAELGKEKEGGGRWPSTLKAIQLVSDTLAAEEPAPPDLRKELQAVVAGCEALGTVVGDVMDRAVNALAMVSDG